MSYETRTRRPSASPRHGGLESLGKRGRAETGSEHPDIVDDGTKIDTSLLLGGGRPIGQDGRSSVDPRDHHLLELRTELTRRQGIGELEPAGRGPRSPRPAPATLARRHGSPREVAGQPSARGCPLTRRVSACRGRGPPDRAEHRVRTPSSPPRDEVRTARREPLEPDPDAPPSVVTHQITMRDRPARAHTTRRQRHRHRHRHQTAAVERKSVGTSNQSPVRAIVAAPVHTTVPTTPSTGATDSS